MSTSPDNPPTNALGSGVKAEDLLDAVRKSGYPLQTRAASQLRHLFEGVGILSVVQEEWGFIDSQSGEPRALDILTETWFPTTSQFVLPKLNLLLECKQSALPYLFFLSEGISANYFPAMAGIPRDQIELRTDDGESTLTMPLAIALGLDKHSFLSTPPATCMSFSRCVRKGSNLELSGADAYNGLVLPLLKAVNHFKKVKQPPDTYIHFSCHVILPVGVIDAPMVAVRTTAGDCDLQLTPWVRVFFHKPEEDSAFVPAAHVSAIDLIHKDYLAAYISTHVMQFAQSFASIVSQHAAEVTTGKGFVKGLESGEGMGHLPEWLQPVDH